MAPSSAPDADTPAGSDGSDSSAARVVGLAAVVGLIAAAVAATIVWRQRENKGAFDRVKDRFG